MSRFRLTVRAEGDLFEIAEYTRRTWGEQQCARYLDQLEECCQRLAEHPILGRSCDQIRRACAAESRVNTLSSIDVTVATF